MYIYIFICTLYRNHISPSHSVSIYTCVLHIIFMIYTISYVYLHLYTYFMIYVYMYVYRIKNSHVSNCMWSQEWVAAALCPWNPSTAGGSMRVQGKCDEFGETCWTPMGNTWIWWCVWKSDLTSLIWKHMFQGWIYLSFVSGNGPI